MDSSRFGRFHRVYGRLVAAGRSTLPRGIERNLGVLLAGLPAMLSAAAVAGLGGGLYGPAAKAAITQWVDEEQRSRLFVLRGVAATIGTGAGPLLGASLLGAPVPVLFGVAAAPHAGLGAATWMLVRSPEKESPGVAIVADTAPVPDPPSETAARPRGTPWRRPLQDRPFMGFSLVTVLAWMLFAQLPIAVPLYARHVLGLGASIGLLFSLGSLAVILFQLPVTPIAASRLQPFTAMAAGVAALGAGRGLIALARGFTGMLVAVLLFMLGAMLLLPTVDSIVSVMAPQRAVGSYFGVATCDWGLGEGLGSVAGGALMHYALGAGRVALPWALYALIGAVVALLFLRLGRKSTAETDLRDQAPSLLFRPGEPAPDAHLHMAAFHKQGEGFLPAGGRMAPLDEYLSAYEMQWRDSQGERHDSQGDASVPLLGHPPDAHGPGGPESGTVRADDPQ